MLRNIGFAAVVALTPAAASAQQAGPSDAEIAHIAYTAGRIDIEAADQALAKTKDPQVRSFAEVMKRDHAAVNEQALALLKKLDVTPQANATSAALSSQASAKLQQMGALEGAAFDRAYVQNEVAFHQTVNTALKDTLIPSADNAELKRLLETGLKLFGAHQTHAEQLSRTLK